MCWGAIWFGGRSDLVRFDCSESEGVRKGVTAKIYRDQIVEKELYRCWLRMKRSWRGYGVPWIVEDNAPVHTAKVARGRGLELGMRYLEHPPSSPCLNPIEHLWNLLKRRLARLQPRPTSSDALFDAAVQIWNEYPQETIDRLIMSMPDRLQAVISAEGGYIDY